MKRFLFMPQTLLLLLAVSVIGQAFPKSCLATDSLLDKKILWISSYHQGYEANDAIERGIRSQLKDKPVEFRAFFMDTKRNDSDSYGQKAAIRALAVIKDFQPDLIIASDDNAQKFVVVPYLRGGAVPVVFCGVNWDAGQYGYPAPNITGMVEVDLAREMYELMRRYAKGPRIGFLSGNVDSERKMVKIYNDQFFDGRLVPYLVTSMAGFKKAFLKAQQNVDMLYIYNYAGIKGWDPNEAELFLSRHTRIPTGSHNGFMTPFVTFVAAKSLQEHGVFAAKTALRILSGVLPEDIPLAENRQVELCVNMRMAKAASLVLPISLLKTATVISREAAYLDPEPESFGPNQYAGRKIFLLDSYNEDYAWSQGIRKGVTDMLYESGAILDSFYMDTKKLRHPDALKQIGKRARDAILAFGPDVIIACDDTAQQYVVVPYLYKKKIPVVFCGVNLTVSEYGYPTAHITGMVEEDAIDRLIGHMLPFAGGGRIGYIAGRTPSQQKVLETYKARGLKARLIPHLVETLSEWKGALRALQKTSDMIVFSNYAGIDGWDDAGAKAFILAHNRLPTGALLDFMAPYVVFSLGKVPEEQGSYAAKTALRILNGTLPADIPVAKNVLYRLTLNLPMADASGITLPYTLLQQADRLIR